MIRYITAKEVILINALVINHYTPKEESRVSSGSMLESAVNNPKQSSFGKDAYPTLWLKGAALYYSLANNHAFVGENKRTALSALIQFLYLNGLKFTASEKNAESFTLFIVEQKDSVPNIMEEIAGWIEENSVEL